MANHRDVLAFVIALVFLVFGMLHGFMAYDGATWAALAFVLHFGLTVGCIACFILFWWLSRMV